MIYQIEYNDYKGVSTKVQWYASNNSGDYTSRVIADGGVVEAYECVVNTVADLTGIYDFGCVDGNPLSFRWHGERYSPLNPSEITFRLIITNKQDSDELQVLLYDSFYCNVQKDGKIIWIGKMFPQLYTESYKQYPYTVELNASDQLGQFKQYQFLLIDFDLPFKWQRPDYSVLDVINKALSEPIVRPNDTMPTTATKLRTSVRVYFLTARLALEESHLDTHNFMEGDEYLSKWEMLEAILEPLHLRLFIWDGVWWLMSYDALWDNAKFTYREYDLNYNGWSFVEQVDIDQGILQFPCVTDPQNVMINRDGVLEYLPAWQGIDIRQEFTKNNSVIYGFCNNSGNYYSGQNGIPLEFTTDGNALRYYTQDNGGVSSTEYEKNAGYVEVPLIANAVGNNNYVLSEIKNFMDYISINANSSTNYSRSDNLGGFSPIYTRFEIRIEDALGQLKHWLWYDQENDRYLWYDEFRTIDTEVGTLSAQVSLPEEYKGLAGEIKFAIYFPYIKTTSQFDPQPLIFNNMQISMSDKDWDAADYSQTSEVIINPRGTQPPFKKTFTWGLAHTSLFDQWEAHLSSSYAASGGFTQYYWLKSGSTGEHPDYRYLLDWLLLNYFDDNSTFTAKLEASYRSNEISPIRLVKDFEGRIYQFMSGEYHDKWNMWRNEYVQFKAIRNVPGTLQKCDFAVDQFNDDFCKWVLYEVSQYINRVEDDGGTIEAWSCVQEELLTLMGKL